MEALPERPTPRTTRAMWLRDQIAWFGLGRLFAGAVSIVAVVSGGVWLVRTPPPPVDAAIPMAGTFTGTTVPAPAEAPSSTDPPSELVVHVAGAVALPGLHRLAAGARVADAVIAAGGPAPDAVLDAINLAQPLRDGDRVVVPAAGDAAAVTGGVTPATPPAEAGAADPAAPVDLNTADVAALEALPGIGPATASAIVAHRELHGPFPSVDALGDVRGIGPAKLDALRGLVRV